MEKMIRNELASNETLSVFIRRRWWLFSLFAAVAVASFVAGFIWSSQADEVKIDPATGRKTRTVYPKKADVDFEGMAIEGELKNPAEFYFQHRPQEKFDSLVKRRRNFHREMLRDAVWSK